MSMYFQVNVQIKDVNEKGKTTKQNETFLVLAISCLDAETITTKKFVDEGTNLDFKVVSIKETKILEVL